MARYQEPDFADYLDQVAAGRLVIKPGFCIRCDAELSQVGDGEVHEWPDHPSPAIRICEVCAGEV